MEEVVAATGVAAVSSGFTTISSDLVTMLGNVAPLAIAVFGVILAWRFGKRFFSSVAK